MPRAEKILVIRFSAMGDVAMTAPVLKAFQQQHTGVELLILSRAFFSPFFADIPNSSFYTFDPKSKHKGFFGLIKLFLELRKQRITAVADLHSNIRSRILSILFLFIGVKSVSLQKGRAEKKQLTRRENKELIPLKQTVKRYAEVFNKLNFPFDLPPNHLENKEAITHTNKWIGVSPFAQHLQKVYPLHKMEKVMLTLANHGHQLFVFGGTSEEQVIAESWATKHPNVSSVVKKMSLTDELELISKLDVMLSMDSSGMHLAALKNIPVVSVWGATHPYAGFLGYGQSISDTVQIDLYCRPCSVYGNVPCYRGDFACMNNLTEQAIIDKVLEKLKDEQKTIFN